MTQFLKNQRLLALCVLSWLCACGGPEKPEMPKVSRKLDATADKIEIKDLKAKIKEDVNADIQLDDGGLEGDKKFSILKQPSHGEIANFSVDSGSLTYIPATDYSGEDSFQYGLEFGGITAKARVDFVIEPVNDPPKAENLSRNVSEQGSTVLKISFSDPDSTTISIKITQAPKKGVLTQGSTIGELIYTPLTNVIGSDEFKFKVSDGLADSSEVSGKLNIVNINDPPVASNKTFNMNEDTTLVGNLDGSDVDTPVLTFAVTKLPTKGTFTLTDSKTGAFSYVPNANYFGQDSVTYTVSDGNSQTDPVTATFVIASVNDAPTAQNFSMEVVEDTPKNEMLKGTDNDGDEKTFSIVTPPSKGVITLTNNKLGQFTYTPNLNQNGADTFTYKVSDGVIASMPATVTVTIAAVNDVPVANNARLDLIEEESRNSVLTGSDVETSSLTFEIVTQPTLGTLSGFNAATGAYTYTGKKDMSGNDSFTFRVNDGAQFSSVATVTIVLTGINDAPVGTDRSFSLNEDTVKSGQLEATDPDSANLTYALSVQPTHGVVAISPSGSWSYTPELNYNGIDSFKFTVSDGALSGVGTISLNVIAVNDAPQAFNSSISTLEDQPATGTLSGIDVDSNKTFIIVSNPTNGSLILTNASTGTFTYTPKLDYVGQDSFTFRVSDGVLNSGNATVTITVGEANDSPVASNLSLSALEDVVKAGKLLGTDVDNTELTYSIVTQPKKGVVVLTANTGDFTYVGEDDYFGSDSFTYRVFDGQAFSNTATVSVTIAAVNDPPVAKASNFNTNKNIPYSGYLQGSDVDSPLLTYSISKNPTKGSVTINQASTGAFTYTPANLQVGSDSFEYRVNDGSASATATVSITIINSNTAPVATAVFLSLAEDIPKSSRLVATDVDLNSLAFSIETSPTKGTVVLANAATGEFTYYPMPNFYGNDSFTFKAYDGTVFSNVATVSITVSGINDAPVVNFTGFSTNEDVPYTGDLGAFDVEGTVLTFQTTRQPTKGSVAYTNTTGGFRYTPNANMNGSDSFVVSVSDGHLVTPATISVIIHPVNDAPVATGRTISLTEDTAFASTLIGSDIDSTSLTYHIVSMPTSGNLTIRDASNGSFTYIPFPNFNGVDTFTFRLHDGLLSSNVATMTVNVAAVNDPPVALPASIIVNEDSGSYVANLPAPNDPDGPSTHYVLYTGGLPASKGTLSLNNAQTGQFTFVPGTNVFGTFSAAYTVSDGTSTSAQAPISITINSINDPPVASNLNVSVIAGETVQLNFPVVDVDNEIVTLSFPGFSSTKGTILGTAPGTSFSYRANEDISGTDTFSYTASDISGATSNIAVVTVTITNPPAIKLAAGYLYTCGISIANDVKCWGQDIRTSTPTVGVTLSVPQSIGLSATEISTGANHACAVLVDHTVKCWGLNTNGQIGLNGGNPSVPTAPVVVPNLTAKKVALGESHSCALEMDNTIKCWGLNNDGQMGVGHTTSMAIPSKLSLNMVDQISGGGYHHCAVSNSRPSCWGNGNFGQIGTGNVNSSTVPVTLPIGIQGKQIAAGRYHTCFIQLDDTVKCWGLNTYGQLGIGSNATQTSPVLVPGLSAKKIMAGGDHTCAILMDNTVKCWGRNHKGQLGLGHYANVLSPAAVPSFKAKSIVTGLSHSCAVSDTNKVFCWGHNANGQLGNNSRDDANTPVQINFP